MQNILIELILTNKCNKRCEYCDLEFKNKSLSFWDLDLFIWFLKNNQAKYTINFFWWEPLLEFEKIKYFIEKSSNYVNRYTIWTNGILLNLDKLDFFRKKDVKIYLSIDNIKLWKDIDLSIIKDYSEIIYINFINDPDFLFNSISVFDKLIEFWFKNISFMPIFSTKKWSKNHLSKLREVYNIILKNTQNINFNTYWYFNWLAIDKQFILDTDLNFYSDLDSLLWIQKQYKNINNMLWEKINSKTKLLSLKSKNLSLKNLLNMYNIDEILKLVFEIPKINNDLLSYKIIDKIIQNGTQKR